VLGVDVNEQVVAQLQSGHATFHEPGLDELLRRGIDSGLLRFTTKLADVRDANVHFLCVGTPQSANSLSTDLTDLWSVVNSLAQELKRESLVVGKSTVPVGTALEVEHRLRENSPAGNDVRLAWNPEFLREGSAIQDTLRPARLVFGVTDGRSAALLREVYATVVPPATPIVCTDLETAELAKVSANVMLATRISALNVLAEVCEAAGADVHRLVESLGLDPRIGRDFLEPGLGFGGSCLPKDLRSLIARSTELGLGLPVELLRVVDSVNAHQRSRVVQMANSMLAKSVPQRREYRIAVLGTAFKPGSDDVRDSPAVEVARNLTGPGRTVSFFDPRARERTKLACQTLIAAAGVNEACEDADVTLVLTGWPEFREIDPTALGEIVRQPNIVDARLVLDADKWVAAGWQFRALGRGVSNT
jgi:UDPglucose 6-dehydrogenase